MQVSPSKPSEAPSGPSSPSRCEGRCKGPLPRTSGWTLRDLVIVLLLGLVNFSHTMCYSVLSPFFTSVALGKGASLVQVGIILGSFEFAGMMSSLVLGNYLIRIGSRFMFISGSFALGVSSALFGCLIHAAKGPWFAVLCSFVRVFQGVSSAAVSTASFAILAYGFPDNVASFVGGLEACCGLGLIAGPPIGAILYTAGGFKLPFFSVGSIAVFTSVLSFFCIPSIKDNCECRPRSCVQLVKRCDLLIPLTTTVLAAASMSFLDLALAAYLGTFGLSPERIGLMFLVSSAGYAFAAPLWGLLVDKMRCTKAVMLLGAVLGSFALFVLGPLTLLDDLGSDFAWVSLLLLGTGISAEIIPPFIDALRLALRCGYPSSLSTFGLISGLTNTCYSLGSFLGPFLGGLVLEKLGFVWSISALAVLHLCLGLFIGVFLAVKALRNHRGNNLENIVISA